MKVRYQVISGKRGEEWLSNTTLFRSEKRARKRFENSFQENRVACLLVYQIDEKKQINLINVEEKRQDMIDIRNANIFVTHDDKVYKRNGKTKLWKTRPDHFRIPVKRGLYDFGYVTQENISKLKEWKS